jgi:tetratricopeptide (TPR) repeat protein
LHLNRARVLRRLKRFAEALQAADQALAVTPAGNPNRAEVFRVRAMVIADAQGPEAALAVLLEASQLHPDDVDARTDRGVLLDKLGRHEEALAAFEEALALDGRRAFNWRNKAFVLRSLKRYDQALEAIDEAIRCRDDVPKYHSWRGTLLHNDLGRYEDALAAIEKALQLDPGGAMDWTNKAVVLRSLKRYDEALEAMDEAVRLDGGDAGRYDWRGTLLHNEMRRNEEALAAFEKALQLDPRQAVTWHNKAIVLRGLRSYDQALEAIDEAIRLEERNPLHLTLRGELLTEHFARYEEARADFARALELKPGLLQAQRHLGIALKQLGKYGEAVSAFDSALAIDGRDAYALYMRGSCLYMLDDHEAAAESVVRSLALDPGFKPTHCLHGAVLMALGRPNEALEAYQRADALGPGDPLLHDSRGQALAALGRHEEALADFDAALRLEDYGNAFLRLEPNRASTHYRRGRSLHALHRYEEAVAAYDVALARNGQLYECRRWRAEALVALQRFEDALGEIERMLAEKPLDAWAQNEHAFVLACLGRLEQVREPAAGALEAWIWTLAMLGRFEQALQHAQVLADPFPHIYCLRANGKVDAAREAARAATQGPVPASGQLRFAYLCAAAGDAEKARAALEACVLPWHPQAMYERVRIHCLLGDREAAIEWFRRAVDAGLRRPGNMAPDPDLQGIAADPRYRSLLERMRC